MVRTLRRAGGFETYVGSVTGTGSQSPSAAAVAAGTAGDRPGGADSSPSTRSTSVGSTRATGRQARSFFTISRQATSQASEQSGRDAT